MGGYALKQLKKLMQTMNVFLTGNTGDKGNNMEALGLVE